MDRALRLLKRVKRRVARAMDRSLGSLIVDGYPVALDAAGAPSGPGWSAAPGDRVGFAINARRAAAGPVHVKDALGNVVATLDARVAPQRLAGEEPWRSGAGYALACIWEVSLQQPSGVYFLHGRPDLFVVVREGVSAKSPVAVLISTNTLNAYSRTASASFYPNPRQVNEVSFCRPLDRAKDHEWGSFLEWLAGERPFGAEVRYLTDFEMESADTLEGARVLIVLGHSEYWTRKAREVFDGFVARGGHVVVAGGNLMWWQVRYGAGQASLVCYKKLALRPVAEGGDPVEDAALKTARWNHAALGYPPAHSIGGDFRHGGYAVFRHEQARGWGGMRVIDAGHPLFEGLGLADGDLIQLYRVTECDGAPLRGLDAHGRPAPDPAAIGARRLEILAYDWTYRGGHTMATMHLLQRAEHGGVVLHLGARECAGHPSTLGGGELIRGIVRNAVARMLHGRELFAGRPAPEVAYPLATPHKGELPAALDGRWAPRR